MKTLSYIVFGSVMILGLQSCVQEENKTNVKNTLQTGDWIVFYFAEDGNVETSNYNDYRMTFNPNGTIAVTGNSTSFNGNYSITGNNDNTKLNLYFSPNDPWEELNEDWDVIQLTDTRITLKHVSGGNGGIDDLTLQRL